VRRAGFWRGLAGSFRAAWDGIVETALHQRNMRVHLVAALLVALLGTAAPFGLAERLALLFCVFLVLAAEVANSALEALVDLVTRERHHLARTAKDAGAGAVLLLALAAVAVLGVIMGSPGVLLAAAPSLWHQALPGLPLVAVVTALLVPVPRDRAVDLALGAAGLFLLVLVALGSVSAMFTALAALLLAIAWACASARLAAAGAPRPGAARPEQQPRPGEAAGPLHKATRSREDHDSTGPRRGSSPHDG
jgi:diacylglycerol kinase (ATP)